MSRGRWDFLADKWQKAFMGTATVQAVICLAFEAYVFAEFQLSLGKSVDDDATNSQYKTIPTFLTLFIFGFLYELLLVWDALRMRNTIQVIGLCVANLALLVYTAIQIDQIHTAITVLNDHGALDTDGIEGPPGTYLWSNIKGYLIAVPIIIAAGTVAMGFIAWKLYRVFAWDILKQIGADYRMTKRFLYYQIYIALLKFDFFFFLGFTVQFLVIVSGKTDVEFGLTVAAIPVTIMILVAAALFTRHEFKLGVWAIVVLYFGGLAYFFFKLVRIYQPGHKQNYAAVRRSLTAFAVATILLIILTIINAFICMSNFGRGLKGHLLKKSDVEKNNTTDDVNLENVKPQLPSRMTID